MYELTRRISLKYIKAYIIEDLLYYLTVMQLAQEWHKLYRSLCVCTISNWFYGGSAGTRTQGHLIKSPFKGVCTDCYWVSWSAIECDIARHETYLPLSPSITDYHVDWRPLDTYRDTCPPFAPCILFQVTSGTRLVWYFSELLACYTRRLLAPGLAFMHVGDSLGYAYLHIF